MVGNETGKHLINDMEKIKQIVKQNNDIHYHKGYAKSNETDDLLKP